MREDSIRLTTKEIEQYYKGLLSKEQVESVKDLMELFAVIAYEEVLHS